MWKNKKNSLSQKKIFYVYQVEESIIFCKPCRNQGKAVEPNTESQYCSVYALSNTGSVRRMRKNPLQNRSEVTHEGSEMSNLIKKLWFLNIKI